MTVEVTLDEALLERARAYAEEASDSDLLNEALRALIQRSAAQTLADLAGSDPSATAGRRHRPGAGPPSGADE